MPKSGVTLSDTDIKKLRKVHKEIVDANKTFKAAVAEATRGLRGNDRQKAWGQAINKLIRENQAFKEALRARIAR